MAIRTITTTVDPLNGQTINTINGLLVADKIIATVLRKNMCVVLTNTPMKHFH